jgi:stage III sporulation protein AG
MKKFGKLGELLGSKNSAIAVTALGTAGLLLILISSFLSDKKQTSPQLPESPVSAASQSESYCRETENRLRDFLRRIDGAGEVEVYLTVGTGERYVYAAEGRKSSQDNRTEEEKKYVMTGGSGQREPLVEMVEVPAVTGAVVVCTGCGDPAVEERIYRAVSAALGIPTSRIYVTKMK